MAGWELSFKGTMLIDLHADTPLWQRLVGYDFCRAHRAPLPAGMWAANLDLPRLQAVNMTAQQTPETQSERPPARNKAHS